MVCRSLLVVLPLALVAGAGLAGEPATTSSSFATTAVEDGSPRYTGDPITLRLKDAELKDVLRVFANLTGLNVIVHPSVSGSVTLELREVPWDQALDLILTVNGCVAERDGNVLLVLPRALARARR